MMWQAFLNNFNPLVKIIHIPSVQLIISEAVGDLSAISASHEALFFFFLSLSIHLSAVITMSEQDCLHIMGEPQQTLRNKFAYATQCSLSKAHFLKSTDVIVLQAFTMYLVSLVTTSAALSSLTTAGS
jgi:hypothetical protein